MHVFDVRGSACVLAVEIVPERELLLLEVRTVDNGGIAILRLGQIAALAAAPVPLARAPVEDLLILQPDGSLALLGARGAVCNLSPTSADLRGLAGTLASEKLRAAIQPQLYGLTSGCTDNAPNMRGETATRRCMEALTQVLPDEAFVRLRDEVDQSKSMQSLEAALMAYRTPSRPASSSRNVAPFSYEATRLGDKQLRQLLRARPSTRGTPQPPGSPPFPAEGREFEAALLCLHVVAQDLHLRVPDRADGLKIGQLVGRLAAAAGFVGWVDTYRRSHGATDLVIQGEPSSDPSKTHWLTDYCPTGPATKPRGLPEEPPDLLVHLAATLAGRRPNAYPDLRDIRELFKLSRQDHYGPDSQPTRLTRQLVDLYRLLTPSTTVNSAGRARACVHRMAVDYRWTTDYLQHLMPHVLLPLREAIRSCQLDPPIDWPAAAYELALRPDLARQQGALSRIKGTSSSATSGENVDGLRVLAAATEDVPVAATPGPDEQPGRAPRGGATRFNEDRRLEEVSRMLCFDKHCIVSAGDRTL